MHPINTRDRKELGTLLQSLAAGDQVLATRADRLARSMFELFAIIKKVSTRGTISQPVRPH
jgi:DNA invertase Pin-like site-specific DNA recombinase